MSFYDVETPLGIELDENYISEDTELMVDIECFGEDVEYCDECGGENGEHAEECSIIFYSCNLENYRF